MFKLKQARDFWQNKKRDFTVGRGRMGRSRFFETIFLAGVICSLYFLGLHLVIACLRALAAPQVLYNNVYYMGVGFIFILFAFGTRRPRLKRLRDMGCPLWLDWPFFLLLVGHGLGSIFYVLNAPGLMPIKKISMVFEINDLFGVIWLIWGLALMLTPSQKNRDPFISTS